LAPAALRRVQLRCRRFPLTSAGEFSVSWLSPQLSAWFSTHHGVIDRSTLLQFGVSTSAVKRLAASGVLMRLHRGVYRLAAAPVDVRTPLVAACTALPTGAVSHTSAGKLWQLRRVPPGGLHLAVPDAWTPQLASVRVHRSCH